MNKKAPECLANETNSPKADGPQALDPRVLDANQLDAASGGFGYYKFDGIEGESRPRQGRG